MRPETDVLVKSFAEYLLDWDRRWRADGETKGRLHEIMDLILEGPERFNHFQTRLDAMYYISVGPETVGQGRFIFKDALKGLYL